MDNRSIQFKGNQMKNQENSLGNNSGSHHGTPELFERDIKLLENYQLWVKTATDAAQKEFERTGYESSYMKDKWIPSVPDMLKSRLFWRIRYGLQPLPAAPPTAAASSRPAQQTPLPRFPPELHFCPSTYSSIFFICCVQPPSFPRSASPRQSAGTFSNPDSVSTSRVPVAVFSRRNSTSVRGPCE